jgi:hypothetical protein
MAELIARVRREIPLERVGAQACSGDCQGCSRKLIEYLESELQSWELRLAQGETPGLADLSRLIKISTKIQRVLVRNGLVASAPGG